MSSDIATLSSFFTEVTRLLDGEDPTVSDISVATLSRLLRIAERRIYRDVRTRWNQKPFAITTTDNKAVLPDDFETASEVHFGRLRLMPTTPQTVRELLYDAPGGNSAVQYFAKIADAFVFWPAVANATVVQGTYYARLPALSDATIPSNALFQAADDLFIFACLVESAPFFDSTKRMPIWADKYASIVRALNKDDAQAAYSTGAMQRRPSTRIIR